MSAARAREDPAPGTGRRREGAHCTCTLLTVRRMAARQSPARPCPVVRATCTPDGRGAAARPEAATRAHEDPAPGNGVARVRPASPACPSRCAGAGPTTPKGPVRSAMCTPDGCRASARSAGVALVPEEPT